MMTKIAFIGAGSLGFTTGLVRDILTFPLLQDATISLMDIDSERLAFAHKAVKKLIQAGNHPAKVEATLDRAAALKDADVVLTTILSGNTEVWRHDIEIPKKYGVDINVGDTRGPAGIFRFLRTLPDLQDIQPRLSLHHRHLALPQRQPAESHILTRWALPSWAKRQEMPILQPVSESALISESQASQRLVKKLAFPFGPTPTLSQIPHS